jgi:outer membrane protein insertion porin family
MTAGPTTSRFQDAQPTTPGELAPRSEVFGRPTAGSLPDPQLDSQDDATAAGHAAEATANQGEVVAEVRIKGNSAVPTHQIMRGLRTRAGRYFDPDLLRQDVEHLWQMKELRRVNGPFLERTEQGVVIAIEVVERALVKSVRFVGNRLLTDWQLRKQADIEVGQPLDAHALRMAGQRLEEYYHQEGFRHTQISLADGDELDPDVVFVINEGRKERVMWVDFQGNTFASDDRLRTFVKAKPSVGNILKGFGLDRTEIDQDVTRLTAYYRTFGFFNARIGREIVESPDNAWVRIRYVIDEGPRFRVNSVSFIGNTKFEAALLEKLLKLKPSDGVNPDFNSGEMNQDVTALRDLYGSEGHVLANVEVEPRFLDAPGLLDLVYKIEEGQQYRVGKINVHIDGDAGITKRQVILNRLGFQPGDIIDSRKIRSSERLLRTAQIFADGSPGSGPAARIVVKPKELMDLATMSEDESLSR